MLPSFFVVGPPRTGTTWLHEVLKDRILLPHTTKETRFFDVHFHRGLDWYCSHFPHRADGLVGEVAPTYFASADARRRIREMIPSAKIICIFRDPVERVLSLYRLKRAYGMIPWNLEEAILRDPELMESSRYATHLRDWQQAFGAAQVLPTFYDDLRDAPQLYLDTFADFIGIPRMQLDAIEVRRMHASDAMTHPRSYYRTRSASLFADWLKARRFGKFVAAVTSSPLRKLFLGGGLAFADLSREVSLMLYDLFRREIEELEIMVNRDLSAWKPLARGVESSEAVA